MDRPPALSLFFCNLCMSAYKDSKLWSAYNNLMLLKPFFKKTHYQENTIQRFFLKIFSIAEVKLWDVNLGLASELVFLPPSNLQKCWIHVRNLIVIIELFLPWVKLKWKLSWYFIQLYLIDLMQIFFNLNQLWYYLCQNTWKDLKPVHFWEYFYSSRIVFVKQFFK